MDPGFSFPTCEQLLGHPPGQVMGIAQLHPQAPSSPLLLPSSTPCLAAKVSSLLPCGQLHPRPTDGEERVVSGRWHKAEGKGGRRYLAQQSRGSPGVTQSNSQNQDGNEQMDSDACRG